MPTTVGLLGTGPRTRGNRYGDRGSHSMPVSHQKQGCVRNMSFLLPQGVAVLCRGWLPPTVEVED